MPLGYGLPISPKGIHLQSPGLWGTLPRTPRASAITTRPASDLAPIFFMTLPRWTLADDEDDRVLGGIPSVGWRDASGHDTIPCSRTQRCVTPQAV
jgi:hypothetical protein